MSAVEFQLCDDAPYPERFYWRIVSTADRRVIATSDGFRTAGDACAMVRLVMAGAHDAEFVRVHHGRRRPALRQAS